MKLYYKKNKVIKLAALVLCIVNTTAVFAETALSYGDINGDGSNNKIDAALVLKEISGVGTLTDAQRAKADVNADGNIDILDPTDIMSNINIVGYGHIQGTGWQNNIRSGNTIGAAGSGKRLEAIRLRLSGGIDGSISYSAHVSNVGWQSYVSDGNLAGTTGKSNAIEAIRIKLSGDISKTYSAEYRAYMAGVGWLDWCADGMTAGSTGLGQQMEGLQVRLVNKDSSKKYTGVYNLTMPTLSARAHIADDGWLAYKGADEVIGSEGRSKSLQALQMTIKSNNSNLTGGIQYKAHVSNIGWQNFKSNGSIAGTTGQNLPVECVQIELTGDLKKYYDIYYCAHVADIGWMGWTKNGGMAGTTGGSAQMEALKIKIVYKGSTSVTTGTAYKKLESTSKSAKMSSFINDANYKNGAAWSASKTPRLSNYGATGCCAYAADFCVYVYGVTPFGSNPFYNVNEIRAGDVIKVTGSQHWFVVLSRNGNTLYTAEGNWGGVVVISNSTYTIQNNRIYRNGSPFRTFSVGYHLE